MAKNATKTALETAARTNSRPQTATKAEPEGARAKRSAERRDAILAAALEEFSASGFAAARLDDVARRANVAKGTIYLHFADKETLFQELVRSQLSPVVAMLVHASHTDLPLRTLADRLIEVFAREIYGTRRKDVIRLIITEGARFPKLAEFYYREVLSRVMNAIRGVFLRAFERGEIRHDAVARFPQLLAAPGVVAIFWHGLFDRFEPLDIRALLRAHFDLVLHDGRAA
jgi:AcrR family transcriptional regulator